MRDRLGGDEVYFDQVRQLRKWGVLPGVTLQVVPIGRDFRAGLSGPFILVETPDRQRVAHVESPFSGRLMADPDVVSALELRYATLRSQALNPQETKGLLDRLLGEQ